MSADHTRDTLARLEAEMVTMRGTLAKQQAALAARQPARKVPRRGRRAGIALVAGMLALVPVSLWAANPTFSDLNTAAAVHQNDIKAIGNAGITTGFEDPSNPGQRLYYPQDTVTREEMASFLARTAGLGGNAPVTNAATLGGYTANGLARVARGVADNDITNKNAAGPFQITSVVPNYSPVVSVTVQTPGDGFILVTGTTGAYVTNTDTVYMRVRNTTTGALATDTSPVQLLFVDDAKSTAGSVFTYGNLSSTFVFPVTGAGAKTFVLESAADNTATSDNYVFSSSITAIFVPFGSGGGGALGEPTQSGGGQGAPTPSHDRGPSVQR